MPKGKVSFIVTARDMMSRGLKRAGASVKRFAKSARLSFLAMSATAVLAVRKIWAEYEKDANALAKVKAVLKATGNAAGFTAQQLLKTANALEGMTGIGADVIMSAQGILASFKEVKGDEFKRATVAILDMSTVLKKAGQDGNTVETAVVQVGKALNDPIRGMAALRRVGVTFTDTQMELVKYFQETNQLAKAQRLVLAELEAEFGGAAAGGDKAVISFNLLKHAIGGFLARIGEVVAQTGEFDGGINTLRKSIEDLTEAGYIETWAEAVKSAFASMLPSMKAVFNGFQNLHKGSRFIAAISGGIIEKAKGAAESAGVNVAVSLAKLYARIKGKESKENLSKLEQVGKQSEQQLTWTDVGANALDIANGGEKSDAHANAAARRKAAREDREARMKASDDEEAARVKAAAAAKAERAEAAAQDAKLLAARMATHEKRKKITKEIEDIEKKIAALQEGAARDAVKAAKIAELTAQIEAATKRRDNAMFRNLEPTEREEFVGFRSRANERRKAQAEQVQLQQKIAQIRGKIDDRRRLSKGEKQFVSDFNAFKVGQANAAKEQAGIQSLEQRRDKIQSDQLAELQGIRKDLAKNLEAA